MHPQTDCSFLTKLPFELRVLIYELVLGNCLISMALGVDDCSRDFDPFTAFWQTAARLLEWRRRSHSSRLMLGEESYQSTRDSGRPIEVALLLTCRFMYSECVQLLYASNAFSFRSLQGFEEFSSRYLDDDDDDDDNNGEKRITWVKKLQINSGDMTFKVPKVVFGASSLQLLSIGVDPDTFLLTGLYVPHSDALRVLLKLSDLPNLTQIEIFWTTWPPWYLSELCARRWAHRQSDKEAEASSSAVSKPLTRIASHPASRQDFRKQHCKGGLTLVQWIQVQVMESMRDQGYSCEFQDLYWAEVVPSLIAGTKMEDGDEGDEGDECDECDECDDISTDEASDWDNASSKEQAFYTDFVSSAEELDLELNELRAERGEEYENFYGEMLDFTS
jgi:hypothetical protein